MTNLYEQNQIVNVGALDGTVEPAEPLRFEEAWASVMVHPRKRAWAFNHHVPTVDELLLGRDNMPFRKTLTMQGPSDGTTFGAEVFRFTMEDIFCTCHRMEDGTCLGLMLNSTKCDISVACFQSFDPVFQNLELTVSRLIVGGVKGRLFALEFCWLKSGVLTVRFAPFKTLTTSIRNELRITHIIHAFHPSEVSLLSAQALCPFHPSDDFVNARFENLLLDNDYYTLSAIDIGFQIACVFCVNRGLMICDCPLPMKRRSAVESRISGYKTRPGKTYWEEFGVAKSICGQPGTVIFNVTKGIYSRNEIVLDSGVMPFDYNIVLNVPTSQSLQFHLSSTGQSVFATRTVLTPFGVRNRKRIRNRNRNVTDTSSVQDSAAATAPIGRSSNDSNNMSSTLSEDSSTNELISIIMGTRKRSRVHQNTSQVGVSRPISTAGNDSIDELDATKSSGGNNNRPATNAMFLSHGTIHRHGRSSNDSNSFEMNAAQAFINNSIAEMTTGNRVPPNTIVTPGLIQPVSTNDDDSFEIDGANTFVNNNNTHVIDNIATTNITTTLPGSSRGNNVQARPSRGSEKVFQCPECGVQIKNKRYNLKRHIQVVHNKERNFECQLPSCGQRFQTKTNLKRHVLNVHKQQPTEQQEQQPLPQAQQQQSQQQQQYQQIEQHQQLLQLQEEQLEPLLNFPTTDSAIEQALFVGDSEHN